MNGHAFPVRVLALALAGCAAAAPAAAHGLPLVDGYDALWKSRPRAMFGAADERPLDDPQSVDGQAFRAWGPIPPDGGRLAAGRHRVEVLGPDITIDHRAFPAARARIFPGEVPAETGADARLFVGVQDVCLQGTAPSSSGTAQRHVHVALVTDAFTRAAHRYDLPSLFGSCLALTRDAGGHLRFLAGTYHTPPGASASDGVDFESWRLRAGHFVKTDDVLRVRFADPEDVYRFHVVVP